VYRVHRQRTATAGRIARWILLFCTLFGLALMHTIGHTGPHAGQHHQLGAAMPVTAGGVAMSALVPAECPAGHCDGHDPGGMSGWSVCVAILGGLVAVVLLAALLSWMMSGRGRAWEKAAGRPPVSRGPPRRAAGLSLVSVAVLRV
jgi:peptidoglycan/LPS O-acetylase OafA/YrhL